VFSEIPVENSDHSVGLCFDCPMSWMEHISFSGMPDGEYFLVLCPLVGALMAYGLSKLRSRRLTPKERPPKRPSRRDNPFKQHLARYPFETRESWAKRAQAQNLAFPSDARDALCAALRGLGIPFRPEEKIVVHGRTYFADVWCYKHRIWWECDGAHHRKQRLKDLGRDEDIAYATGFRVIRRFNHWYTKPGLSDRILIEIGRKSG
jgi:very-short-patch-repair endonuclease